MVLTITVDCKSTLESQQAKAIAIKAMPASRATIKEPGSTTDVPNKREMKVAGASKKKIPASASTTDVTVKKYFI